jgi:hypothetical protein
VTRCKLVSGCFAVYMCMRAFFSSMGVFAFSVGCNVGF